MPHLTKSRFVAGCQCHDLLWRRVHEPDAPELEPDLALEDLFEQGREVGVKARSCVPGGVLVEAQGHSAEERVSATEQALAAGAPVVYEACFVADEVFVSVDILERVGNGGFGLIEVKSSTKVKDEYIADVAIQKHVLGRCGLELERAEVMHLNGECRYPDLSNLFVREDVTAEVDEFLPQVPGEIKAQLRMLAGPFPDGGFNKHCLSVKACPFHDRCWPEERPEHVLTLYRVRTEKKWALMEEGIESIHNLETWTHELNKTAQRQVRSVRAGARLLGKGLAEALESQVPRGVRLAFLDFETVQRAIPVWVGCGPWAQMPVQFSCHKESKKPGWPAHFEFLAESGEDCREAMAQALIEACNGAGGVVVYFAGFERARIRDLVVEAPRLAKELEEIEAKLIDLLPLVREYVYDPDFMGSFSLKAVLPALLPDAGYDDLEIADGATASAHLSRLLFRPDLIAADEREPLRAKLLEYCKRDTWATMRLLEKLREMARRELV